MASDLRKAWKDFKKKHPAFEESKNFKSDVGPQLDKFEKAREEFSELRDALLKKAAEVVALGKSVAAALKGYEAVVKELQESDKTVKADFSKANFDDFADRYVDQYASVKVE
jgi:hypothetical protein